MNIGTGNIKEASFGTQGQDNATQDSGEVKGSSPNYYCPFSLKFFRFCYEHPAAAKTTFIALGIIFAPVLIPAVLIGSIAVFAIGTSNGYGGQDLLQKMALLTTVVYSYFFPCKHEMKSHVFEEGSRGNASLHYEGDIPVLTLKAPSGENGSFVLGKDQGYLLALAMQKMLKTWMNSFLWLLFPSPDKVPALCQTLSKTIPSAYLEELAGMAEGFNEKMEEIKAKDRITRDQLLLMHLLPDMLHSTPKSLEHLLLNKKTCSGNAVLTHAQTTGCTSIIDHDQTKGIVFGRNMDWPSLGVAGGYTFMIRRSIGERTILEVGTPGLLGTSTAMNSDGVALAMNVCEGATQNAKEGLPACILNRMCIESSGSLEEVRQFLGKHPALGPYHLIAADQDQAAAFHMYQGKNDTHYQRELKLGEGPVVTTNCRYDEAGPYRHHFYSQERESNIQLHFAKFPKEDRVKAVQSALRLPLVNNAETLHHVIMLPKSKEMSITFDNAFAAEHQTHSMIIAL